jgi:hypothetical protein
VRGERQEGDGGKGKGEGKTKNGFRRWDLTEVKRSNVSKNLSSRFKNGEIDGRRVLC